MIAFEPVQGGGSLFTRMQDVVRKAFSAAQSAADVAIAIKDVFTTAMPGSKVLTFGTNAPDAVFATTPTAYVQTTLPDGTVVMWPVWRVQ